MVRFLLSKNADMEALSGVKLQFMKITIQYSINIFTVSN